MFSKAKNRMQSCAVFNEIVSKLGIVLPHGVICCLPNTDVIITNTKYNDQIF